MKPYPRSWPRNIDPIAVLSLQTSLDPKLELFHYDGTVSYKSKGIPPITQEPIRTKLGVGIGPGRGSRDTYDISFGTPDVSLDHLLSQKEILTEVMNAGMDVDINEVVTHRRGCVTEIPPSLEDCEVLQGCNYLFEHQTSRGNFYRTYRRISGLPVSNFVRIIKNELVDNDIIKVRQLREIARRMKGLLKTDWIVADGRGWQDLGKNTPNHRFPHSMVEITTSLANQRWWQDTGIVHPVSTKFDGYSLIIRMYLLYKRRKLVAI